MSDEKKYHLDGDCNYRAAKHAIESLRDGNKVILKMYSDDYMSTYLSVEDYNFWVDQKALNH